METKAKLSFFNYSLTCFGSLWSETWLPVFLQAPPIIWLLPALGSLLLLFSGHRVTDSTGCSGPHPGIPLHLFQVDSQSSLCSQIPPMLQNLTSALRFIGDFSTMLVCFSLQILFNSYSLLFLFFLSALSPARLVALQRQNFMLFKNLPNSH